MRQGILQDIKEIVEEWEGKNYSAFGRGFIGITIGIKVFKKEALGRIAPRLFACPFQKGGRHGKSSMHQTIGLSFGDTKPLSLRTHADSIALFVE